ncbi:LacI family transcriptional regulator [Pelagibius litoralis]|uniref:LacI family transcriptional regulator n=1 Tax=Pelagibius litoralis TaxID=374515 RepID=A0A967EXL9_9PROT|nr:LacI family DNA-binding transcriptional regulator [Pelagibius litoralis]NIA69296.1 LacI family transcriptional regulator [Pelagibius litoralis]
MTKQRRTTEKKPGVRTVAAATGLSVATVSRVLNGSTLVREETRAQVIASMRELDYAPNAAARALATRRTRTIAAVIPTLSHSIFARFLNAVELALAERGYALVIATTDGDPQQEMVRVGEVLNMGAEGLILSGATHPPELLRLIEQRGLPTVCTSIHDPRYVLPTIGYDNAALGREALRYLIGLGHRRVAVVHGPLENNDRTVLRLKGVKRGAGKDCVLDLVETSLDSEGGALSTRRLLEGPERPTAILCLSDVLALGVLFEARRSGFSVPADLSIMGFDDLDWAAVCEPPLTTLRLPTARMGRCTADALVDYLDNDSELPHVKLKAALVERASTAKANGPRQ